MKFMFMKDCRYADTDHTLPFLKFAQAALATPYRHVEIREQVLGQTDTHFFVLRHIGDNRGYHGTR